MTVLPLTLPLTDASWGTLLGAEPPPPPPHPWRRGPSAKHEAAWHACRQNVLRSISSSCAMSCAVGALARRPRAFAVFSKTYARRSRTGFRLAEHVPARAVAFR